MPQRLWRPTRLASRKPGPEAILDRGHPQAYGLRHFYLFNEGGGLPRNLVRPSENITLGTGVTWSRNTPLWGPVLNFNNTTNGRAVLSTGFTPAATVFSVEMGLRVAVSPPTGQFAYLFASQSAAGNGIMVSNGTLVTGWDIDTTTADLQVGALPSLNIWYHLVFVYVSTSLATIYENGLSVASGSLAGAFTTPLGWLGADGTNASNTFGGDMAWLRVWDRALNPTDVAALRVDPFDMVISPAEEAAVYAILGGKTLPAFDVRQLVPLMSPPSGGGSIISGSATFIDDAKVVQTSAQLLDATALIDDALLVQSKAILLDTTALVDDALLVQSGAKLLTTGALVDDAKAVQSGVLVIDPSAPLVDDAKLVESAAIMRATGAIIDDAKVVQSSAIIIDPSAPVVANAVLLGNAGSQATIIANAALVASGTVISGAAMVANVALVASAAQIVDAAALVDDAKVVQSARIVAFGLVVAAEALLIATQGPIGVAPVATVASNGTPRASRSANGTPNGSVASNTPRGRVG